MATLGEMKARIARETTRDDLLDDGTIAAEITSAVNYYRADRFWFNEKRSQVVFNSVVGQTDYGAAAHPDLDEVLEMDDADNMVGSLVVNGKAGVLVFVELAQHVVERGGDADRDHLFARDHDLAGGEVR